ncbi:hypothetical protein GW796_08415 [archaeon]|nr:hypothetical protein [archaeon]
MMTFRFTDKQMKDMGYTAWRELPDGIILAVGNMAFGNGRLFVDVNNCGYEDCYCYDSLELAEKSMKEYNQDVDKEPEGWKRHPFSGRRRENGDKSKEYVRA